MLSVSRLTPLFLAFTPVSYTHLDEAKKIYDEVVKENPQTEAASVAQRRNVALRQ